MNEKDKVSVIANLYREPVLIVEDRKENQDLLQGLCKRSGIPCDIAANGRVALDLCAENKYSVFIVDLMMPVMDGKTFIEELRRQDPSAVILVQSALDGADTIIEIMRMGVYDYIIKPIDPEVFTKVLLKALEYRYLKDLETSQSMTAGQKIRSQIEWLNYKESRRMVAQDSAESKSIYSLTTSLAQGAGFGTLITMIDILKGALVADGDHYRIEKPLVDMILENNEYCRLQLEGLSYATDILEKDFRLEDVDSASLIRSFPDILARVLPFMKDKNIKVTLPEPSGNYKLRINREIMEIVIEEIVVNAYKYSSKNSTINIFTHVNQGYFWINVKNDVDLKPYGGVPKEYEKLVLEPFFRIHPPDESVAKVERIGFGLGLTVADYVAKKHGGIFIIHDVKDLTAEKEKMCVLSELLLPVWT